MAKADKVEKSNDNAKFAEGGDTPMFGQGDRTVTAPMDASHERAPGKTGKTPGPGASNKYAEGGSTKMFGYSPSVPAKAGITSAR